MFKGRHETDQSKAIPWLRGIGYVGLTSLKHPEFQTLAKSLCPATSNFADGFMLHSERMTICPAARWREVFRTCRIFHAASAHSERIQVTEWALLTPSQHFDRTTVVAQSM